MKNFRTIMLPIIFVLFVSFGNYNLYCENEQERIAEIERKKLVYNNCLINQNNMNIDMIYEKNQLDSLLKNYKVSVYYDDLNSNQEYKYNEYRVYYGASLIKLVEALYIYDKKVNLDDMVRYYGKYKSDYSLCMDKRNIGDNVSIKELVECTLSVSDNTAHFMLINYIGFNNLQEYGRSLGASNILLGGDTYGYQSVIDTNIYLNRLYEIISDGSEYGTFLKKVMMNDYFGYLNVNNEINTAHKYGYYDINFHDIGITFEEKPYAISILTLEGYNNYSEVINLISKSINNYHKTYYDKLKNMCYINVYGDNK